MADNPIIDRVSIEIEATAKSAGTAIQGMESDLKRLKSALSSVDTGNLTNLQNALTQINNAIDKAVSDTGKKTITPKVDTSEMSKSEKDINSDINKIKQSLAGLQSLKESALSGDSSSATSLSRRLISLQGDIDKVGEKLKQAGDNKLGVSIDSDQLQAYRETLAEIQAQVSQTRGSLSRMTGPKIDMSFLQDGLSNVASLASKAASSLSKMASNAIKNGLSGIKTSISNIASALTKIGSTATKGVSTGFSKILKYGFGIRSLYVLFRRLRTAIKDSFTELQKSGADYQTTKANVEALKNSLTTLKYQFGAAFEPIFNTVAPALQTLINYLVAVMNTISAFIAKLTGKSTYSKAVAATGTIAKNTGSAAGSAKELNKQLQGFDELNNLSGDSGSSGGGGSGSGSGSNVTYVEESVDSALTTFWDSLADAISSGEWETVGSMISEKLTSALNGINWDNIYSTASNFGTNFANFLNGLITDDLFSALGTTIGNSINTALTGLNSFGTTFDWTNFGKSIASGINSLVESTDLDLAADTFNKWANGILNTLGTAVQNIDWTQIRDKVCESINKIDTTGIGDKFGTLVNGLANAVYSLVSDKQSWKDLGTKIGDGINAFLNSMSQDNGSGMNGWTATTAGLTSLASGIISSLATTIKTVSWKDVATGIGDMINGIKATDLGLSLGDLVSGIANALYTLVSDKDKWKDLGTKIGEGINGVLTSMGSVDAQTGLTGWQALGNTISSAFSGISTAFEKALETINWDDVKGAIKGFLGSINLDSIAVVISDLAVSFMLVEAAKTALKALLEKEAMSVITTSLGPTGTVSVGQVAVAVTLSFVIGWQIGGKLYESATGYEGASQGFISTVKDAWDGLIGENKIQFNLADFIEFTITDIGNGDGWLKDTHLYESISKIYESVEDSFTKIFSGDEVSHGYNGAPSEAVEYIEGDNKSWSDIGKNVVEGIIEGWKSLCTIEHFLSPVTAFKDALIDALVSLFKIGSPAKAMYEYGENIFDGIIEGFKEKMKNYNFIELMKELYDYFNTDEETTTNGDVKSGQSPTHTLSDAEGARNKLHVKIKTELTGDAKSTEDLSKLTDSFKGLTDEASKGATSKFDTESDTSVVEQSINYGGLSKARSSWKKTTTSKFDTNPDTSKVNESITSGGLFKAIKSWAVTTTSKFDTKPDTQAVEDSISSGGFKKAKDNWKGQTVQFIATENSQAVTNSIDKGGFKKAKDNWKGQNADFTTSAKTNDVVSAYRNTLYDMKTTKWKGQNASFTTTASTGTVTSAYNNTLNNLKSVWTGTNANFTTTASTQNATSARDGALKNLRDTWSGYSRTAIFSAQTSGVGETVQARDTTLLDLWRTWPTYGNTATFSANFSYNENDLSKSIKNMTDYIQNQLNGITLKVKVSTTNQESVPKALGGSYYGGSWHDIPQYAKGGKPNYGSMFIAGEAGPEIVGHLNGRTEVLNKSQIASTIHSAFVSSMAQFGNRMLATPESVAIQSGSYSAYNSSINDGQTALLAEQNRLLAEQNQLLMEIASKDVSISSRDVFNAVKSESKRYNNMTGSSPFLF